MNDQERPTGQWTIWWDEDYWAAERQGKQGCVAGADTWEKLLPTMVDAEQSWDAAMLDIQGVVKSTPPSELEP